MQAPVRIAATASLASEVSRAGGLGALGASWTKPEVLRERIRSIQRVTDRPFCVNLVLDFEQDERLEVAVEERAPVVSFSFGLRPHLIARVRGRRASAGTGRLSGRGSSGRRCGRRRADRAGCRGWRPCAGRRGSAAAVGRVRRAVSLPLHAAGGIGDPASARAALASRAVAVVIGTRFVASDECDAHPRYKARLLEAEARDTVLTQLFDVGWPESPHRVIRDST